jgi:hypothetical protein
METETLNFVKEFYETGWNHLIWVIGGAGVILPVLLNFSNSRSIKEKLELHKKDLDIEFKKKRTELENLVQKQLNEVDTRLREVDERNKKIEQNQHLICGNSLVSSAMGIPDAHFKFTWLLMSIQEFVKADNAEMLASTFTFMIQPLFSNIDILFTPKEYKHIQMQLIKKTISFLKENNRQGNLDVYIDILENTFKEKLCPLNRGNEILLKETPHDHHRT